jgi:hypothetical protein
VRRRWYGRPRAAMRYPIPGPIDVGDDGTISPPERLISKAR